MMSSLVSSSFRRLVASSASNCSSRHAGRTLLSLASRQSSVEKPVVATYSSTPTNYLSTAPKTEENNNNIVVFPPNLKIDPRAKCSPFYGLERIQNKESEESADETRENNEIDANDRAGDELNNESKDQNDDELNDDELNDDEYSDNEEEAGEILYDLSQKDQHEAHHKVKAIPLPQRLKVPIHHLQSNSTSGSIHLNPSIFAMDPIRIDILCRVVQYQRNKKRNKRNAAAITKTISTVSGSGRKVRQQKGLGRARAGHSRPAHWRGGAKAHGPKGKVQDYTTKLNNKVRRLGLKHALSQKLKERNLLLVNDWSDVASYKTKALGQLLYKSFAVGGRGGTTAFLIDAPPSFYDDSENEDSSETMYVGGVNVNLKVASGNLPKVKVCNQLGCNVYDVLKHEKLIISLEALKALEARLG